MDVAQELVQMNLVYRERFPRATANMEARLEELHARLLDVISPSTALGVNANVNVPNSSSTGAESAAAVGAGAGAGAAVEVEVTVGGAAGAMGTTGSDGPARDREREGVSVIGSGSGKSQLLGEAVRPAVDAVAHFMLQQLASYVSECLRQSREHQLSTQYFIGLNEDISALINNAHVRLCRPCPLLRVRCHSA